MTTCYRTSTRVLVAGDDLDLLNLICFALRNADFDSVGVTNGPEALAAVNQDRFSLTVIDFNLSVPNGIEVCAAIRKRSDIPILILSERDREADLLDALNAGADEYLVKPFNPRILIALVRALVRRASPDKTPSTRQSRFRLDAEELVFIHPEGAVSLTQLEVRVLRLLMLNAGKTLSHNNLIAEAWSNNPKADRNTLKHAVFRLRKKMSGIPDAYEALKTSAGGYSWSEGSIGARTTHIKKPA